MKPYKFIVGTVLLFLSLPLLVVVLQNPQTTRQRAQTPPQPPQCTAAKGVCTDSLTGCFAEETDVGKLDCGTGQTCCAAIIPPQCFAKKGVCVVADSGCLANETNTGQLDCDPGRICCAVNVPPQCKAKNGACILKTNDCFEGETEAGQLDCGSDQRCCATAPTPSAGGQTPTTSSTQPTPSTSSPQPGSGQAGPSATVVPSVKPTATSVPPTATPVPTAIPPTIPAGNTTLNLTVFLHGIGNSGDNRNPTNSMSNKTPKQTSRVFTITIGNYQRDIALQYINGAFTGTLDMGTSWSTSQYDIKVKAAGFMEATAPGQMIAAGEQTQLSSVSLMAGDSNGDNQLNALDYNAIISCHNVTVATDSCSSTQKEMTDLNDDGLNNGVDYNLFLREIGG